MAKWLTDMEKILNEVSKHIEKKGTQEHKHLTDWESKFTKDIQNLEKFGQEFESWFKD